MCFDSVGMILPVNVILILKWNYRSKYLKAMQNVWEPQCMTSIISGIVSLESLVSAINKNIWTMDWCRERGWNTWLPPLGLMEEVELGRCRLTDWLCPGGQAERKAAGLRRRAWAQSKDLSWGPTKEEPGLYRNTVYTICMFYYYYYIILYRTNRSHSLSGEGHQISSWLSECRYCSPPPLP